MNSLCLFRTGREISLGCFLLLVHAAGLPIAGQQLDWPTERGNPLGTGAVPQKLPDPLVEHWRYEAGEPIEGSPAVSRGRLFVGDVEGTLHALELDSGKSVWKQKIDGGFVSAVAVAGDTVIAGDYNGMVYAFDFAEGKQRWTLETNAEISGGPAFFGENVLIPSQDGNLYCCRIADGKLIWKYETSDQIQCSPTIAGDLTFLGGCDGQLHRVDLKSGQASGEPLPLDGPTLSTPAVQENLAFLTTHGGLVLAFDWKSNERVWEFNDPDRRQEYRSSPAVTAEAVVASSQFRQVRGFDPQTGKLLWSTPLRRFAEASPVIAGDDVWIAATDGRLYRMDLKSGEIRSQQEFRGSFVASPIVADKRLILANSAGVVIALGATAEE